MSFQSHNGSFAHVFRKELEEIAHNCDLEKNNTITLDNVFQSAVKKNRNVLEQICSQLMQEGSQIIGIEHLLHLNTLAAQGESCLICSAHTSNFDVPNFYTLMKRQGIETLKCFDRIVFVAGRKLNEDSPYTKMLTEMFTRVVVCPKSYLDSISLHDSKTLSLVKKINFAAQRHIIKLRKEGYIVFLFPTGTRSRPDAEKSFVALKETDAYLKSFDNVCLMNILGNTLLPRNSIDLINEIPKKDKITFIVSPVLKTAEIRKKALKDSVNHDSKSEEKQVVANYVMKLINRLQITTQ